VLHSSRRRTRRIAPVIALLAVALLAADADAARHLGGATSQDAPITLQLSRDGKQAEFARMMVQAPCDDGSMLGYWARIDFERRVPDDPDIGTHVVPDPKLGRNGRVGGAGSSAEVFGENMVGILTEELRGTVRRSGRASGTLSSDITLVDIDTGEIVTECRTGPLSWSARGKRGRVYAGAADNGTPLVVELSRKREKVALGFGWAAQCVPEGFVIANHRMGDLPVTDGRFDEAFEVPFQQDGRSLRIAFELAGGLTATKASGEIAVKLTELDPAGNAVMTCDAGRFGWKARSG